MTEKTALCQLIEAVEAGEISIGKGATLAFIPLRPEQRRTAMAAYNGGLDAAKALHEALLPKHWVELDILGGNDFARIDGPQLIFPHRGRLDGNPARAWLIAILKAYEAQP